MSAMYHLGSQGRRIASLRLHSKTLSLRAEKRKWGRRRNLWLRNTSCWSISLGDEFADISSSTFWVLKYLQLYSKLQLLVTIVQPQEQVAKCKFWLAQQKGGFSIVVNHHHHHTWDSHVKTHVRICSEEIWEWEKAHSPAMFCGKLEEMTMIWATASRILITAFKDFPRDVKRSSFSFRRQA